MKKLVVAVVAGVFLSAAVGVGLDTKPVLANHGTSLSGTTSGAGEIVGETFLADFNVGVFDVLESQTLAGDITGTRSHAVTERATFNLNTSEGTYHAIFEFDGSIAGRSCSGVMVETGSVDLSTGEFVGLWHVLFNDCGFETVSGVHAATLTNTSPTTFTLEGKYRGFAK